MTVPASTQTAIVLPDGQVTIPKNIQDLLGIAPGNHVSFVVYGSRVEIVNAAHFAMKRFQDQMEGEAEKSGLTTDVAVMDLVKEIREDDERLY